jgi:hypothetical protein
VGFPEHTHPFTRFQFVGLGGHDERIVPDRPKPREGVPILVGHDPALNEQDHATERSSIGKIGFE